MNVTLLNEIKKPAGKNVAIEGNKLIDMNTNNYQNPEILGKLLYTINDECVVIEKKISNNVTKIYISLDLIKIVITQ
jgi:hypothetical protein